MEMIKENFIKEPILTDIDSYCHKYLIFTVPQKRVSLNI